MPFQLECGHIRDHQPGALPRRHIDLSPAGRAGRRRFLTEVVQHSRHQLLFGRNADVATPN
ncbi:hypothetical protein [Nocardia sp. NPDC049526]|uniref:hypothetical protein n=1 Tax=Nocardia sp. NPDC049526 TaxID=3364316 RepID=UPI0037A9FAC0